MKSKMKYERLNFKNGSPPAINAAALNHIETGLVEVSESINKLEEEIKNKPNADDVYSTDEADEHFLSAKEPNGSVQAKHIVNKAVNEDKLSDGVVEKINSKAERDLFLRKSSTQLVKLADINTTINGVNIVIKNNHISIKGKATNPINDSILIDTGISEFEPNKDYVVSIQNVVDGNPENDYIGMFLWVTFDGGDHKTVQVFDYDTVTKINVSTSKKFQLAWNIPPSEYEYDKEFDFKIEYGTEATPFEPYYTVENLANKSVGFGKLSTDLQDTLNSKAVASQFIKRSKSQLIKLTDTEFESNGLNISIKNNHVHIKGTTTSSLNSFIKFDEGIKQFEAGIDYTVSVQNLVTKDNTSGLCNIYLCKDTESNEYKSVRVNTSNSSTTFNLANTENVTLAWNLFASESVPQTFDVEFDFKIEYGSEVTPFEPYYVVGSVANGSISKEKLSEYVQNNLSAINAELPNKAEMSSLLNKTSYFEFKDISEFNGANGEPITIETGYYYGIFTHNTTAGFECTSVPIECKEGDIFRITSATTNSDNHQAVVKCYDKNQTLISSHLEGTGNGIKLVTDRIFIVPKNVAYIAFNCRTTYNDVKIYSLKVEKAVPYTNQYGLIANTLVSSLPSATIFGAIAKAEGDSIIQGTGAGNRSFVHLLADKYNMRLNCTAVGNTTLAVHPDNGNIKDSEGNPSTSICERILNNISIDTPYDLIIFDGGTNDITKLAKNQMKLGVITDGINEEFDTTTILGALEAICLHLNTTQLTAKKLFVFPQSRVELLKLTNEVNAEMKKVLHKYGIPYIDLSDINSLGHWNSSVAKGYYATILNTNGEEIPDPLHPNLEGHRRFIAPEIEKALLFGSYSGSSGGSASTSSGNGSYNLTEADINTITNKVLENFIDMSEVGL